MLKKPFALRSWLISVAAILSLFFIAYLVYDRAELRRSLREQERQRKDPPQVIQKAEPPAPAIRFSLPPSSAEENLLEEWVLRAASLRKYLEANPTQKIPELQLLRAEDWILVAKENPMETEEDLRRAGRELRRMAKQKFGPQLSSALLAYLQGSSGVLPNDISSLQPYLQPPIDRSFLERYQVNPAAIDAKGRRRLEIVETSVVDHESDSRLHVWKNGFSIKSTSMLRTAIEDAQVAFAKANNGTRPKSVQDILPFMPDEKLREQYRRLMEKK